MARVKSPYDEPREVPWLDRIDEHPVQPGEVVEVSEEMLASFLEAGWFAGDEETRGRAGELLDAGVISALAVEGVEDSRAEEIAAHLADEGSGT